MELLSRTGITPRRHGDATWLRNPWRRRKFCRRAADTIRRCVNRFRKTDPCSRIARMSAATCGTVSPTSAPGYRCAHPGYLLHSFGLFAPCLRDRETFPNLILVAPSIEHIRAGKLRALAVTTTTRSPALPDIPTVADFVPGYEASLGVGIGAPRNTPVEIVDKLNKEINAALVDPKFKAHLELTAGTVLPGSPADFGKLLADETEKWAKVIKTAGIKAE